jgi:hypothetical protein
MKKNKIIDKLGCGPFALSVKCSVKDRRNWELATDDETDPPKEKSLAWGFVGVAMNSPEENRFYLSDAAFLNTDDERDKAVEAANALDDLSAEIGGLAATMRQMLADNPKNTAT